MFQCLTPSGHDLCFNTAHCEINSTTTCTPCPPGYEADNTLFHQPNCILPSNFYGWYALEQGLLNVPAMLLILYEIQYSRSIARSVFIILVIGMLASIIMALSMYLQNGFYEWAGISVLILAIVGNRAIILLAQVLLGPLLALNVSTQIEKTIRQSLRLTEIFIDIIEIGPVIAGIITCRGDDNTFNIAQVCAVSSLFVSSLTLIMIIIFVTHKLAREIAGVNTTNSSNTTGVIAPTNSTSNKNNGHNNNNNIISKIDAETPTQDSSNIAVTGKSSNVNKEYRQSNVTNKQDTLVDFQKRLDTFRTRFLILFITLLPGFFVVPIVLGVLGSVPYMFALLIIIIHGLFITMMSLVIFLRSKRKNNNGYRSSRLESAQ
jgi:hypothetical protein